MLDCHFVEAMNRTFTDGYEVVTSYRNSKNYGENWISAGYALWFIRESRYLNNSRMLMGTSCAISGTGFLFSRKVIESTNGWVFHLLTEDIEFSVYHILQGRTIGFCADAVLYDEQPATFRQSWRQRLRWARGFLQVFRKYGFGLIKGMGKGRFSCYDMSMTVMPAFLLTVALIVSYLVVGPVRPGRRRRVRDHLLPRLVLHPANAGRPIRGALRDGPLYHHHRVGEHPHHPRQEGALHHHLPHLHADLHPHLPGGPVQPEGAVEAHPAPPADRRVLEAAAAGTKRIQNQ